MITQNKELQRLAREELLVSLTKCESKLITHLYLTVILFIVLGTGGIFNNLAVEGNGCKMPVLGVSPYSTDTHFGVRDASGIKYPLLVDRFKIGTWVYSIGDFLILGAFSLLVVNSIFVFLYNINSMKLGKYLRNIYK